MEEAYELADAAEAGDDVKLLDELGDVLFQVHFLSLLLEERGAGDLAAVAEHCSRKLVRRHPHVFGEVQADDAAAVLRNWDAIKRVEEREACGGASGAAGAGSASGAGGAADAGSASGPAGAGALPASLPATIYARKTQRRAAAAGEAQPGAEAALQAVREEAERLDAVAGSEAGPPPSDSARPDGELRDERFEALGELLYAAVGAGRELGVDSELALRAAANRRLEASDAEANRAKREDGPR